MDGLFASTFKLAYPRKYNFFVEKCDETEAPNVQRNRVNCPSYDECMNWAMYQKNISILIADMFAEETYADGGYFGENSEPLECRLENFGIEAGIYKYWIS